MFSRNIGKKNRMAIAAVQYLKIPKFESEVVYEAKTDKVSALLVDKNEYPSMTKEIVSKAFGPKGIRTMDRTKLYRDNGSQSGPWGCNIRLKPFVEGERQLGTK